MKSNITLRRLSVLFIVLLFLVLFISLFRSGIIWYERDIDYRFINNNITSERIKSKIYLAAQSCNENLLLKLSDVSENVTNDLSKYNINYYDEVFEPKDIEVVTENNSQLVIITYYENEVGKKVSDPLFSELRNISVLRQQEKTGVLYCNDNSILIEYANNYGHGASHYGKLMVTPLGDELYYFISTQFI